MNVINHDEALLFAQMHFQDSNLARCYLDRDSAYDALVAALEECEDHFATRTDVNHVLYGEPVPNAEMRLRKVIRAALKAAKVSP